MRSKPRLVDLRGGRDSPPPRPTEQKSQTPRRSNLRVRRQKIRAVVTAAFCVCALLLGYAIHLISYMDAISYRHVSITGAQDTLPTLIQKFVEDKFIESEKGYISGRNVLVFDYSKLEDQIEQVFPRVKSAKVSRDGALSNGLTITLVERQPFAQWCEDESLQSCFLVDETGVVFAAANIVGTTSLPTPYTFFGPLSTSTSAQLANPPYGSLFAGDNFASIRAMLQSLVDSGMHPSGARIENQTDFSVQLQEGFYLKASYDEDAQTMAKNLQLILSSDALRETDRSLEYVDLRFGNRVYYKFKGETTETQE